MANDFFIPKITLEGLAESGARLAGQLASEAISKARLNAPKTNPYVKGISSTSNSPINSNNPYSGKISAVITADQELYKSDIGTSVYADVTFGDPTTPTIYTNKNGKQITIPVITFQAILISLSYPRNIVKTEIQGRDGTVKEYIGESDAHITFRGVITGANGSYPSAEVQQLQSLIKAPIAIPIVCTFLNDKDIHSIVFEDRQLDQEEGGYSYQTFVLNAISDVPQELQIL